MPGLVPGIHVSGGQNVDSRGEPGHDEARVLDLPHGWKPEIHTRRTPGTPLNSKLSVICAFGLTFKARAVCSRNLWEA